MAAAVFISLFPIALLIGLGHVLARSGFIAPAFWPQAERLAYFVLLPALFFSALANADFTGVPVLAIAGVLIAGLLGAALLLVLVQEVSGQDGAAFTSVFQGSVRFNNYVGLTAATALFGPAALGIAALANAVIVPTVNILSILVFSRYGTARAGLGATVKRILVNPLVLSCLGGFAMQATGLPLPPGLDGGLRALGQAALPIGLLCVGAALDWSALRTGTRPVALASLAKFGLLPVLTFALCLWAGLGGTAALVVMLFQCLPTASSSYVLARQLGGDAPLMAGIITFQTIAAFATMPLTLILAARLLG
ncbi:AEC family transporter [Halodurantibacterium flavum]|uniref:AEC family transporter n=1 Tax=Halodurantibacterium flavum TaxID=1382802 RepID=A0ABW4S5V2_9RHOB